MRSKATLAWLAFRWVLLPALAIVSIGVACKFVEAGPASSDVASEPPATSSDEAEAVAAGDVSGSLADGRSTEIAKEEADSNAAETSESAQTETKRAAPEAPKKLPKVLDVIESGPMPTKEYAALYTEPEIRFTGGKYDNQVFKYRLYVPKGTKPGKTYPLFVWLHGLGESYHGGNTAQLRWLGSALRFTEERLERNQCFVLAAKCPYSETWYSAYRDAPADQADPANNDMTSVLKAIIDKTLDEHPIDRDRISLSGMSSGGSGCWEMAIRYPDLFAAVLPMAPGGGDDSRIARIKDVPVWAFHNRYDDRSDIEDVAATVDALNKAGGRAYLTEQFQIGHIVYSLKYDKLTDWIFAQKRGQARWGEPPGSVVLNPPLTSLEPAEEGWKAHQLALQIGTPLLVVIACYLEVRRRRKEAKAAAQEQGEELQAAPTTG